MQAQEETNKAKVTYYFRKEGTRHVHVIRRSAFFEIYFACTYVTHPGPSIYFCVSHVACYFAALHETTKIYTRFQKCSHSLGK